MSAAGVSELVAGEAVSGEFFRTLGIEPVVGRLIGPGDDRADAPPVAVLAEAVWRRRFGSDRAVLGQSVRMAGRIFIVVGVAPSGFRSGTRLGRVGAPMSVWVPLSGAPGWNGAARLDLSRRNLRALSVIGRLAEGRTIDQAGALLEPLARQFDGHDPLTWSGAPVRRTLRAAPAVDDSRLRRNSENARVILALPALILLIACTNLATLVLSRGASRLHEFAVRRALGASRWRLVREQLVEGAIVALVGGLSGLWIAMQMLRGVLNLIRETFGGVPESSLFAFEPRLAPPVVLAAGLFALLSLAVANLIPALQLTRGSDRRTLAADTGAGAVPRWRGRSNLIALQVCVSVCLFLLTALGVTWLRGEFTYAIRHGLDGVARADVPFGLQQQEEPRARETIDRILAELRRDPATSNVAVGSSDRGTEPVEMTTGSKPFIGRGLDPWASLRVATPALPDMLGDVLESGRHFTHLDDEAAERVIIVNRSQARRLFGPGEHLGKPVVLRRPRSATPQPETRVIVGITADAVDERGQVEPVAYVPYWQHFTGDISIFVRARTGTDVEAVLPRLHRAIQRADPDVAISFLGRADRSRRWVQAAVATLVTTAAGVLATIALVLSMAGLFGVLSHVVARRTREFGVRIALGASRARVTRLVLKDGCRPVVEGLVMGLGAAVVIAMLLQTDFTRDIAIDPIAFAVAAGPLLIAAAIACYLPARRAARVEPTVALRDI